ncbi:MAG TPA: TonB-dependent receptor [Dokdonella sp.]
MDRISGTRRLAFAIAAALAAAAHAEDTTVVPIAASASSDAAADPSRSDAAAADAADRARRDAHEPARLPGVEVRAASAAVETPAFPASAATIDAARIDATINAVDVEDAIKYLPSLFVRKRNYGDTQPVLATRTWGVGSSARTLVYVDDIPISALIANNNTLGAPRWGVVSPQEVGGVTMLYGPFSAAYAGNSIGGVLRIDTREPERGEFSFAQTEALQSLDQYRTHGDYATSQTGATFGGRSGAFSWFVGANLQNSFSQPLSYVTAASPPAGTSGAIDATNKLGQPADVLGAGGLLHTRQTSLDAKLGYDLASWLHATYLVGYWRNDADSYVQTYLTDADGRPSYGGAAGFASNTYDLQEEHLMQGLALRTDGGGRWDGEVVVTYYDFLRDRQLSPAGTPSGTEFTPNGRRADLGGTNWATFDLESVRHAAPGGAHELSFGAHADEYTLKNPTRNTAAWRDGGSAGGLFSAGSGKTDTYALWAQDAWTFAPAWRATLGGRYERWRASDGFNFSGGTAIVQPNRDDGAFSPKATLQWSVATDARVTASLARAVRFPTVAELYQIVSTGSTFVSPNPDLKAERATSGELAFEHELDGGELRVALFREDTRDALVAQTSTLDGAPVPVSFVQNVGKIRNRGVELAARKGDLLVRGLELSGSVTFVDSTIVSDPGFVGTNGSTATGKHAPNVPRWRASAVATYRPDARWSLTLAGRYSGTQYSTLDNADAVAHVFGAFDRFLVFDARVRCALDAHWSAALGIDNLGDEKYFLYHPFPARTLVAELEATF